MSPVEVRLEDEGEESEGSHHEMLRRKEVRLEVAEGKHGCEG